MLAQLRNKRIALFSTLLIIFALSAKMLVPIAHASNATVGSKGFLASLCIGNKVVSVNFDLPSNDSSTPKTNINAVNQCPLCFIAEHESPVNEALDIVVKGQADTYLPSPYLSLHPVALNSSFSIRAPPTLLLL